MASRIVLQYYIIFLAINGLHSSVLNRESLGVISQLLREDSRDPLIVVVDSSKKISAIEDDLYDEEDRNAASERTSRENAINHEKVNENYDTVLYNVLRTSNVIVEDEDRKEDKRKVIERAIRERCQARVVCTEKCSAENTALRKRYCQKSCKAVFDHLVKCPPPGNEWKKKKKPPPPPPPKDSCGSDSCASKNSCDNDSCKPKDSCQASDSCKPKDSCQSNDSCKQKDSCQSNDSCNPKTTARKPRTGKTCRPTWRN